MLDFHFASRNAGSPWVHITCNLAGLGRNAKNAQIAQLNREAANLTASGWQVTWDVTA